jgi:hypothetical protein
MIDPDVDSSQLNLNLQDEEKHLLAMIEDVKARYGFDGVALKVTEETNQYYLGVTVGGYESDAFNIYKVTPEQAALAIEMGIETVEDKTKFTTILRNNIQSR